MAWKTRDMLPLTNQPVYRKQSAWTEADFPVARHINTSQFLCRLPPGSQALGATGIYCRLHRPVFRRQADQKPDSVTLALLADRRSPEGGAKIKRLPLGLFARTLVLDNGMPASRPRRA